MWQEEMQCKAAIKVAAKKLWCTNVLWHNFRNDPFANDPISESLIICTSSVARRRRKLKELQEGGQIKEIGSALAAVGRLEFEKTRPKSC